MATYNTDGMAVMVFPITPVTNELQQNTFGQKEP
jgi:hypothetical protein